MHAFLISYTSLKLINKKKTPKFQLIINISKDFIIMAGM